MSEVKIRPATHADLPAVERLLVAAALPAEGVGDFFPGNYAVATRDTEVVAAIGVENYGAHGLLRSAVVADPLRGLGLGAELTRERLDWSRQRGFEDVFLLTTTAASFFEKLGFSRVDRGAVPPEVQQAPEFASICPSTAVVMRLPLS
jgi:amino-acid N-acetyltransferase